MCYFPTSVLALEDVRRRSWNVRPFLSFIKVKSHMCRYKQLICHFIRSESWCENIKTNLGNIWPFIFVFINSNLYLISSPNTYWTYWTTLVIMTQKLKLGMTVQELDPETMTPVWPLFLKTNTGQRRLFILPIMGNWLYCGTSGCVCMFEGGCSLEQDVAVQTPKSLFLLVFAQEMKLWEKKKTHILYCKPQVLSMPIAGTLPQSVSLSA